MACMVRHYTLVAVAQQSGPFPVIGEKQGHIQGLDPSVIIDALAIIMGHEEKELCKPGNLALCLIQDTASNVLGSKERVSLSLFLWLLVCSDDNEWVVEFQIF